MPTLNRQLRKHLEKVVIDARRAAEEGAAKALESLAVAQPKPWRSLAPEQQALRNRLRARARQLGDRRNAKEGTQEIGHLVQECAYEHWHRMLFARFLAENELLIEPESGVSISLEDCRELAREQGADWMELAARYAVRMLPQVFRAGDPVLEVALALETRKELERMLESLPAEVFQADDSLGWTYQFWQAERKDEVNASEKKIGAEEIPAVTQLFTEDYMVEFLLHNTLGAWWAGKHGPVTTSTEEEARTAVALPARGGLPGVFWTYLRFIQGDDGLWRPVAGMFPAWPTEARLIRLLDPCMGSGHFVVFALPLIARLRMEEEGLPAAEAIHATLRDNLFGLELDERCTQIGAFNLALAAWKLGGYQSVPPLHIACSGLAPNISANTWITLAGDDDRLQRGMTGLYNLFKDAPVLGSLIDPRGAAGNLVEADFHELQPVLAQALQAESGDEDRAEMGVVAKGLAKAAEILAGQFTLVATNVPFLGREKQVDRLRDYVDERQPDARADLACVMLKRCLAFVAAEGTVAAVSPQYWLFLGRYRAFRERILQTTSLRLIAKLGSRAFETITGEVVNATLVVMQNGIADGNEVALLDANETLGIEEKAKVLRGAAPLRMSQAAQLKNPDSIIGYAKGDAEGSLLLRYAYSYQGLATSDNAQFIRGFWEIPSIRCGWEPFQMAPSCTTRVDGCSWVLHWENGEGRYFLHTRALKAAGRLGGWRSGEEAWGKRGVAVNRMGALPACLYTGAMFDCNVAVIIPREPKDFSWITAYLQSENYAREVRRLNQKPSVTNLTLVKVPAQKDVWEQRRAPASALQLVSADPTQWLFGGHPSSSDEPLQVAVARLLGYRWPRQSGSCFPDCPSISNDGLEQHVDADGIVCLSALRNESSAAERLYELLAQAFGKQWSAARHDELLSQAGFAGSTLADWLHDGFFEQHGKLFHHRPFIWHIWDGLKGGFSALLNYHKLAMPHGQGRKLLEKLSHTYLGDWLSRQRAEQRAGAEGADARVAAAVHLKSQLEAIIAGEPPYDLFIRWKPLHEQPLGWDPDLNDGIRLNIRPFLVAETLSGKSILRKEPKVNWARSGGIEPERPKSDFPWFWGWDEETVDFTGGQAFDGNRWNDLHYTRAFKQEARERNAREVRPRR